MPFSPPEPPVPVDLQRIQQYVWTRYVNHDSPEQALDEAEALATLARHHGGDLDADAECFYYGILAFERSFAEPERRQELLELALTAFKAYRRQTSVGFAWEAVEDRYLETLEMLGFDPRTATH